MSAHGLTSRRGAEKLLSEGRVFVNGRRAALGDSADAARDRITVDGKPLPAAISAQYCSRLNVRNSIIRNCMGGGVSLLKANRCAIENNRIYDLYKTGISFIDGGAGYCKANSNWMRNLSEGISIQIGHMQCMWNDIAEIGRSAITLWSSLLCSWM